MSRTNELIAAFDVVSGKYLRGEVEEEVSLQEEITPLLINILEEISADPTHYIDEGHTAELYAVALLAHFRETKAHLPIIRAFSIPDEQREYTAITLKCLPDEPGSGKRDNEPAYLSAPV